MLTRSVCCGMNTLHFELEVVRIAGVLQGGFIADQALRVQIVEGLIERLHTVLGGAGANQDQSLAEAIRQIDQMARSIRTLSDYLGRHPEALIGGKTKDAR